MEVLDTSIANVALPHMAGSLGASPEEATWVLTSYLVSSAIILPISGWLMARMGRKRFYMSCVVMFTACSLLCGIAPTLPFLIFARILQGLGGGGLAPSEQAILADSFPVAKRGQAFAVYGMAVVCAPAIGPTLGGWITDNFNWHWIFFINLPVGLLSLCLSQRMVEDPPYLQAKKERARQDRHHGPGPGRGGRRLPRIRARQGPGKGLVRRSRRSPHSPSSPPARWPCSSGGSGAIPIPSST